MKQIYLMGMKHTGKSQHGIALATALGWDFLDTDRMIQELDSAESGMRRTVRDIYREDGVDRFRQLELTAMQLIADQKNNVVVATGGGICDNPQALQSMEGGLRVHLYDTLESITERVLRGGIPAFLDASDDETARARFAELYEHRVPIYDRIADIRIDLAGRDLTSARSHIISTIEEYLNGRK